MCWTWLRIQHSLTHKHPLKIIFNINGWKPQQFRSIYTNWRFSWSQINGIIWNVSKNFRTQSFNVEKLLPEEQRERREVKSYSFSEIDSLDFGPVRMWCTFTHTHTHRVCMETEWDFTSPNTKWLLKSVLLAWSTYQIYTNIAFINYASQSIVSYWIIKYSLDVMWITSRYKAHTQNTNGKCIYKYCHFFGILCPNTGTRLMVLPRLILFHIIFFRFSMFDTHAPPFKLCTHIYR